MTSEAQKNAGYLIPDPITGYELLCVQFWIPNDILYIGAFTGNLENLAQWWNWEKTYTPGDTRASQAAQYWRYLIDTYLCIQFNKPKEDDGMPCCDDNEILSRFTADGTFQTSSDGGATWVDDPGRDPRNQAIEAPPLPGEASDNKRCAAADNVRDLFTQYRDNLNSMLDASPTLVSIIAGILAFLAVITGVSGAAIGISVLIIGLASAMLALSSGGVTALITAGLLNEFRCLVYCRMDNDGRLTYEAWQGLLSDISATFDDFPEIFFYQTVASMGFIGVNNAGTMGAATADDCSECGCECQEIDVPLGLGHPVFTGEIGESGVLYRFTCSGTGDYAVGSNYFGDAFYYTPGDDWATQVNDGVHQIKVDGFYISPPAYASDHIYHFDLTGTGMVWGLEMPDPDDPSNDSGLIHVKICRLG